MYTLYNMTTKQNINRNERGNDMITEDKKIEILATLATFKNQGIRKDIKSIGIVNRYQDLVMGMTKAELKDFEESLDRDQRENFFWANSCTLSMDSMMDILKTTYISRKVETLFNEAVKSVDEREMKLALRESEADRKVREAEERILQLQTDLEGMRDSRNAYMEDVDDMRERNNQQSVWNNGLETQVEELKTINRELDSALDIVLKKVRS